MTSRDTLDSFRANREGGEPADEAEHFYLCAACGQAVDMRRLGDVFHHEDDGHEPIGRDAMTVFKAERLTFGPADLNVEHIPLEDFYRAPADDFARVAIEKQNAAIEELLRDGAGKGLDLAISEPEMLRSDRTFGWDMAWRHMWVDPEAPVVPAGRRWRIIKCAELNAAAATTSRL